MSHNNPCVSIGVPVFNGEKYLAQALDSLLAQTYTDFEVIISDNASTDGTQEICRAYTAKDQRVRYFRNEKNLGAAPNFNRTFELASGKYFKWAAYDDIHAPEFLAKCVEALDQNPDISLCFPKAKAIDEHGAFIDDYDPKPDTSSPKPEERFRNLILAPHMALQVFGLIRSSVLARTGLMGNYPSSDEVLLAELALLGRFYEVPERLFFTRLHAEQSIRGILAVRRARVAWFDTALTNKIVLTTWRYFFECVRIIRQSPLSRSQRAYCYIQLARWCSKPPHIRAAGKDLLLAAIQFLRSFSKPKTDNQGMLQKAN